MGLNFKRGFRQAAPHLANAARRLIKPLVSLLVFVAITACVFFIRQGWSLSYTDYLWGKFIVLCGLAFLAGLFFTGRR
jgi:hypothetical protein